MEAGLFSFFSENNTITITGHSTTCWFSRGCLRVRSPRTQTWMWKSQPLFSSLRVQRKTNCPSGLQQGQLASGLTSTPRHEMCTDSDPQRFLKISPWISTVQSWRTIDV